MNCSICNKPIQLVPSAQERARKYGETPAYYTKLFATHSDCLIQSRKELTSALIARLTASQTRAVVGTVEKPAS